MSLNSAIVGLAMTFTLSALGSPNPAAKAEMTDCADPVYRSTLLAKRVDADSYWTAVKFLREIADAGKISVVHWRMKGRGDNQSGDRLMCDLIERYGDRVDKFVAYKIIRHWKINRIEDDLVRRLTIGRNSSSGKVDSAPSWSFFWPDGSEFRIKGPPTKDDYRSILRDEYFPKLDQIFNLVR